MNRKEKDRVTPDLIRSTILALVPHLKLPDEKKRSLIVETQRSDFSQPSVVEYFIGIVGVAPYEAALRSALGSTVSSMAIATEPTERKSLVIKAYCHGGDVAFFGGVDLEFEASINNALFGHSVSRKRARRSQQTISLQSVERKISSLLADRNYEFSTAFAEGAQRALSAVLSELLAEATETNRSDASQADLISVATQPAGPKKSGTQKILLHHVLAVVQRLNRDLQIPSTVGGQWERKVLDRIVDVGRPKFGF